jgi:hypothetical protein
MLLINQSLKKAHTNIPPDKEAAKHSLEFSKTKDTKLSEDQPLH